MDRLKPVRMLKGWPTTRRRGPLPAGIVAFQPAPNSCSSGLLATGGICCAQSLHNILAPLNLDPDQAVFVRG